MSLKSKESAVRAAIEALEHTACYYGFSEGNEQREVQRFAIMEAVKAYAASYYRVKDGRRRRR